MFGHKDTLKASKNTLSDSESPFKKDSDYRNPPSLDDLGEAALYGVDLCYKHLIGRYSLTEGGQSDKLMVVHYLRATPKFEFMEISINGGEPIWVQPYPNSPGIDYGHSLGNFTVKFVYDDEKDFVTERLPLGSAAAD